jgi:tartrate dehydrogenase/decarboxylase/D-malate dehydrogenase
MAVQQTVFTRRGVNRVMRFAFELARKRGKHLTSATKSNGIIHTMPFWDDCFRALAVEYPDIRTDQYHIDILTAHFVRHPDWFDVVVGSNLGIAPSANLNPEKEFPSMFEPVHGSAPDIAGKGIANPIGQIWSGAMMLRHLGVEEGADAIEAAISAILAKSQERTPDIGGKSSTRDLGEAIAKQVSGA